jgi:hypothetical protein
MPSSTFVHIVGDRYDIDALNSWKFEERHRCVENASKFRLHPTGNAEVNDRRCDEHEEPDSRIFAHAIAYILQRQNDAVNV